MRLPDGVHHPLGRLRVREVAAHRDRTASLILDAAGEFASRPFGGVVVDRQIEAGLGQPQTDRAADADGAAGDECDFSHGTPGG